MRITVIAYVEQEGSRDCDVVVHQVARGLKANGHAVSRLYLHSDLPRFLTGIRRRQPDLVFNLVESFDDDLIGGLVGVTGVLDLLRLPHTGGGPGEIYLQEDKALAKKLLAYENIAFPHFATFAEDSDFETGGNLRMPLFVKPLRNEASIGIDARASLVRNTSELMERVRHIHREFGDAALAEEYIEGREFYVGVLGNLESIAFPPIEMDFSGLPDHAPNVLDAAAKFDTTSRAYRGTRAVIAEIEDELKARLQRIAMQACRALRVRDYGRVDLRVTPDGEIYVIEVNANCYLDRDGEFVMAAAAAGIDYEALIQRIVDLAAERRRLKPRNPPKLSAAESSSA
jgi:D-alanine-D-alanine ligase